MPENNYDAVVLGLGAMGSAALFHLAARDARVLGLEQFDIPHDRGSSHGSTRVIRKAYFEDPRYVPLLHRAYELWRELERLAGEKLLHLCGGINIGPPNHPCIRGVLDSVRLHGLAHELLTAPEISRRFPALSPDDSDVGLFESDAGFLLPERCILAHVEAAARCGASVLTRQRVLHLEPHPSHFILRTERDEFRAARLILSAGAWLPDLLLTVDRAAPQSTFTLPLRVERQVQLWFQPSRPQFFEPGTLPVFIHFDADRSHYGIPSYNGRDVKICRHHGGPTVTPDSVDRNVSAADEADVRAFVRRRIPLADGPLLAGKVCLYTNTPDDHFILGPHPAHPGILLASPCSGHGFKFAAVVGEILADLALAGRTRHDIAMFDPLRFR